MFNDPRMIHVKITTSTSLHTSDSKEFCPASSSRHCRRRCAGATILGQMTCAYDLFRKNYRMYHNTLNESQQTGGCFFMFILCEWFASDTDLIGSILPIG